jgi:pyruvate formate lyase activating enzyme
MGASRKMGFAVGLQTNGIFPKVVRRLVEDHLVDRVALDVKARWERYDSLLKEKYTHAVQESLAFCQEAVAAGALAECEVVVTLFRGYEDEVPHIARAAGKLDLVLQQGVEGMVPPLSAAELKKAGDRLKRPVKVRTREEGEVLHCG